MDTYHTMFNCKRWEEERRKIHELCEREGGGTTQYSEAAHRVEKGDTRGTRLHSGYTCKTETPETGTKREYAVEEQGRGMGLQ